MCQGMVAFNIYFLSSLFCKPTGYLSGLLTLDCTYELVSGFTAKGIILNNQETHSFLSDTKIASLL